jgi:hypothetical protein
MKVYVTKDGVNLYDLFRAGVRFGARHSAFRYTEAEWFAALEEALGKDYVASLETIDGVLARQKKAGTMAERALQDWHDLEEGGFDGQEAMESYFASKAKEIVQRDTDCDDSTIYIFSDGSGICDNWADTVAFTAEEAPDYKTN